MGGMAFCKIKIRKLTYTEDINLFQQLHGSFELLKILILGYCRESIRYICGVSRKSKTMSPSKLSLLLLGLLALGINLNFVQAMPTDLLDDLDNFDDEED
ncbi:hypothetical protein CEXT_153731 [Caerostris extrusa]|uniref:Essential MCU regulator, mitochondrial n=1 Tax=Caerostris extrusa TaxID=172846 RepID=A0AAV4NQD0_CAEEX|nr:hypothetical protein CEXT_153731 [Caerostris extrusa]